VLIGVAAAPIRDGQLIFSTTASDMFRKKLSRPLPDSAAWQFYRRNDLAPFIGYILMDRKLCHSFQVISAQRIFLRWAFPSAVSKIGTGKI